MLKSDPCFIGMHSWSHYHAGWQENVFSVHHSHSRVKNLHLFAPWTNNKNISIHIPDCSGVATGKWRVRTSPLMFRLFLILRSANQLKSFFYIWGYLMYVYCNFDCSPAKKIFPSPPLFLGWQRHCLIVPFDVWDFEWQKKCQTSGVI